MFTNAYFSRYFADRYFPPIGAEVVIPDHVVSCVVATAIYNQGAVQMETYMQGNTEGEVYPQGSVRGIVYKQGNTVGEVYKQGSSASQIGCN